MIRIKGRNWARAEGRNWVMVTEKTVPDERLTAFTSGDGTERSPYFVTLWALERLAVVEQTPFGGVLELEAI